MELVIFSGIQGAGKSTYFQSHFSTTHLRVSLDNHTSRSREWDLYNELIASSKPVVIDNTNQTVIDRAKYIEVAKPLGYQILGYQFVVPVSVAINRNSHRAEQKKVPDFVIRNTCKKMQALSYQEGFDQIFLIDQNGQMSQSSR